MDLIKKKLNSNKVSSFADYFDLDREIQQTLKQRKIQADRVIKISILSNFTIKGLKEVLNVKCCLLGALPEFYLGEYNQFIQEIIDEKSNLYRFNPDLIIIFLDLKSLLGELYFSFYQFSENKRIGIIEEKFEELKMLLSRLENKSSAKIIFNNFEVPIFSPFGVLENKQPAGLRQLIQNLNNQLVALSRDSGRLFVFDYDIFCSRFGKDNILDHKMYYLADLKLDFKYLPDLAEEYLGYIKPLLALTKKCLVLDLDNVLWGGVIGEDGVEKIKLGPTPEGRPFWEFQKYIKSLYDRGIILAINSKNNLSDVQEIFTRHPYMVLKDECFAAKQINWHDKITNMKAIAEDLNIGLDSLIFIDDDELNREMVKNVLPEVMVVDLPKDPAFYPRTLMALNDFNTLAITEEDKAKGKIYTQQRKRKEMAAETANIEEYLEKLKTVITISKDNEFNIPRVSQLTQKTNQFNMTTRRYLEEEIKKFALANDYGVYSVKVEDKFGDNGLVGAMIVKKEDNYWLIDTFLLSCRILGRKIEFVFLNKIIEYARNEGVKIIQGEFIPTKKNLPAKNFFRDFGFEKNQESPEKIIYQLNLDKKIKPIEYIKIIEQI